MNVAYQRDKHYIKHNIKNDENDFQRFSWVFGVCLLFFASYNIDYSYFMLSFDYYPSQLA